MLTLFTPVWKGNKKGFTLIEIMIVVAVIGILAAVLIPSAISMKKDAKMAGVDTNIRSVQAAAEGVITTSADKAAITTTLKSKFDGSLKNPISEAKTVISTPTDIATLNAVATNDSMVIYNPTAGINTKALADTAIASVNNTALAGAVIAVPWGNSALEGVTFYAVGTAGKVTTAAGQSDQYTVNKK